MTLHSHLERTIANEYTGQSSRQEIARTAASLAGWKVEAALPLPAKCVLIGAHHTSATDLFAALLLLEATGFKFQWVAKDTLFWGPLGRLLRSLGGMPLNHQDRARFVERMVTAFWEHDEFRLALLPEDTRQKAPSWKTGFYYIALGAIVPIIFGFADYERKVVGLGPSLMPSGDIEADFALIRKFYAGIKGKYPGQQSEIRTKPRRETAES